jgi:hypothetical protein
MTNDEKLGKLESRVYSLEFLSFFLRTNNPSLKRKRFFFLSREGSAWGSIVLEVEQKLHKEIN